MKKIMVGGEFLKKAPSSNLLYHQKRTVEALKDYAVVFNTYPTGSGKTRAAFERLKQSNENTLIIAPTNEILVQHYNDAVDFVTVNKLNFRVVRVDAKVISNIAKKYPDRRGKILYNILENPSEYREELNLGGKYGKVIIIVNPDIFYYCVYGFYGKLDKSNLMETMMTKFNYIIIDEFHYYNSKQLMNFLYFMALSKHFGYMDEKRKICILTATPDTLVEKYFKKIGLNYKMISQENEKKESEDYEKINSLSKMDLYITNKSLEECTLEYYKNNNLEEDSVIISESLIKVHRIKQGLYNLKIKKEKIGLITGVIDSSERKEAVDKKIIIATTTVDIGYNFSKRGKKSQNIDTAIIEATTADEALQRIGRAGRILGKVIQDKRCKIIMCVSNEIYDKFRNLESEITREELKNLIKNKMPENKLLKRYIQSGAIKEFMNPLDDLYYKFPKESFENLDRENVIAVFYEELNQIFAMGKGKSFKEMQKEVEICKKYKSFINEYKNKKDINEQKNLVLDKFYDGFKGNGILNRRLLEKAITETDPENPIETYDLEDLEIVEINELKISFINEILDYMERKICLDNTLMNFRGERPSIKTVIYDKFNIFTQERKVFNYDIFHILRYYSIYFYNSKKEFLIDIEKDCVEINEDEVLGNEKFYVKINGIKDSITKIDYNYKIKLDRKTFERVYADSAKAIKGLEISASEKTKLGYEIRALKEEIQLYFKEKYVPIFIIVDDRIKSQIRRIIKDKSIILERLEVRFLDGSRKEYDVLLGSNAKLIDYEILRLKDKTEK